MTPDELRARLSEAGLEPYADALVGLARPSIRLNPTSPPTDDGPGTTALGGEPDLPETTDWPRFRDVPLSFVAQVNLADVTSLDMGGLLPTSGLLSFFYESSQSVWGFDPADRGGWAVLFTPAGVPIAHRAAPSGIPNDARYGRRGLRVDAETTYAPWEFAEVASLGLSRDELFAYAQALGDGEDLPVHRLLGDPQPIQGDMQLECQLVSNGLYCGDPSGYSDPRADVLRHGAVDWRLLLQIDSDDDAGMMWGDVGRIYYWMRRDDLAARAWDAAWLILQCS
jgi:uncharacterized protein YwqG